MPQLQMSKIRKYQARGGYQESRRRWNPADPNSFGLPAGTSCPGKTAFCTSCYAGRAEGYAGVGEAMANNLRLLEDAGTVDAMADLLDDMIARYRRHNVNVRLEAPWIFRIHWDGDFFSTDYARAWARVIAANPDIIFWAYTRSFVPAVNVVPILDGLTNLRLYLSIDTGNAVMAGHIRRLHPDVLAAYCGPDYKRARELADPTRQAPIICPENAERMPLVNPKGVGACLECKVCPDGRRDIMFSTSHREDSTVVAITPRTRLPTAPDGSLPDPYPCALPGCDTLIVPTGRRGKPRTYCTRAHQTRALYLRKKAAATA